MGGFGLKVSHYNDLQQDSKDSNAKVSKLLKNSLRITKELQRPLRISEEPRTPKGSEELLK